jgi:DNA-binding transcriptional regulator YiaG
MDRDGEAAFLPQAVELLDRVQVLAMSVFDRPPSPGYITTLRKALGLTQQQLGERLGVDKMTVSRWECGTVKPSRDSLTLLDKLRKQAIRKGVTLAT